MKKTVVILTRLYIKEDTDEDEFKPIKCPDSDNHKLIESLEIDILILHGHDKRFTSKNKFGELSAEVQHLLENRKAFLFYHSGNERTIPELSQVSSASIDHPFVDSITYTLGGGGEALVRGNMVAALYESINANNYQKANECALEMLKYFQHDTNTQEVFSIVNALCNLPFKKNLDEVVRLISSNNIMKNIKIDSTPVCEYLQANYHDRVKMKDVAIIVKKQIQTI